MELDGTKPRLGTISPGFYEEPQEPELKPPPDFLTEMPSFYSGDGAERTHALRALLRRETGDGSECLDGTQSGLLGKQARQVFCLAEVVLRVGQAGDHGMGEAFGLNVQSDVTDPSYV